MEKRFNQSVFEELKILLQDRVTSETSIRNEHGAGYSYHACTPPDCVVFPKNTQEVAEIVKICAKHKTPIIPFGAGTSLEGHILALEGGVCIDLSKMNNIIEVNTDDMYVTVESG